MQRTTISIFIVFASLALALGCASTPPPTPAQPWNQARASLLAEEMSKSADAWQLEVRQANPDRLGAGSSEEGMGLTQKTQFVSEQARALAGRLKAGDGRDQTYDDFRSLKEQMDDAQVLQARTALGDQVPLAWAKFRRDYEQLKPYYEK
jgi:hypothetical protein